MALLGVAWTVIAIVVVTTDLTAPLPTALVAFSSSSG